MYYALEVFNSAGRKIAFYDFYKNMLQQARKDAKQLIKDGAARVVILKEGANKNECCVKWSEVEILETEMKFKITLAEGGVKEVEGLEFSKVIEDCAHEFVVHKSDTSIGYAVSHRKSGLRVTEVSNHALAVCLGDKIVAANWILEKLMNGLGGPTLHAVLCAVPALS
jgi:hypothetical protein